MSFVDACLHSLLPSVCVYLRSIVTFMDERWTKQNNQTRKKSQFYCAANSACCVEISYCTFTISHKYTNTKREGERETFLFTIVVLCDSVVVILCGVHIFGVFNCYVFCAFEIRHTTFMALAIRSIKYGHWLNRIHIVNWIKRNIWTVDKNRSKIKCSHRWRISVYFYSYWVCWLADKNKRFIFVSFRSILFEFKH